jgi:propionaldehyde dehydrogenase
MIVEETQMGRYEDKIAKHMAVINNTPGTECLTTDALSGDEGLMLEEYAPFGVIGAITPVTNPTETIINNTISMIAGGNAVVFNVHPSAKKVCAHCLRILNRTIVENGGPADLITMAKEPTMENVEKLCQSPKVKLMSGTGGTAMVNALLRSGKKTIGAGAGNPPVLVDDTADIQLAAKEIYRGASFDNNLLCLAEKEVFVMDRVADQLIEGLVGEGAYLLSPSELPRLLELVFYKDEKGYHANTKGSEGTPPKSWRESGSIGRMQG